MEKDPFGQRKVIAPLDEALVRQELAATEETPAVTASQSAATETAPESIPDVVQITNPVPAEKSPLIPDEPSRFPWVRTLLIGLLIPVVWIALIAGIVSLLGLIAGEARTTPAVALFVVGTVVAGPWIAGLVVILVASSLLKRMGVVSSFVLATGTLVFFVGAVLALQSARLFTTGLSFGGSIDLSTWAGLQAGWLALLIVSGAIGMTLLVLVTNTVRDRLPGFAVAVLVILIVGAPWGAYRVAEASIPSAQQRLEQTLQLNGR